MKYLIDNEGLIFNNPADAVLFAMNNNRSEVKVTQEETNMTECKNKGRSVQISQSVLRLLMRLEQADWLIVSSTMNHVTLVTKD